MRSQERKLSQKATQFLKDLKNFFDVNKTNIKGFLTSGSINIKDFSKISMGEFEDIVDFSGSRLNAKQLFSEFATENIIPFQYFIDEYNKANSQIPAIPRINLIAQPKLSLQLQRESPINKASPAPQAELKYYRFEGKINKQHIQYCQKLSNLLKLNKQYIDQSNPITHEGTYQKASVIFNSAYEMTEQSASVLNRASRISALAKSIQPKDIIQDNLGDCYFLSTLASIAIHYPEVIDRNILFSVNPCHYYVVKLFIDGKWQYIVTDDRFPCQNGKTIFAKPHGKQIWVMLLQKCFAKVYRSYKSIEGGRPAEAFNVLAGAPSQSYFAINSENKKTAKNKLIEANENKYVCTAITSDNLKHLSEVKQRQIGLASKHAYSILKIVNIDGETIVKLQNPQGQLVWTGDWSFRSTKWTEQLRKKYNYKNDPKDGTFYIDWNNFIKYFDDFAICKINPNYQNSSLYLSAQQSTQKMLIKLFINKNGTYHISIYQINQRKYQNNKEYKYHSINMFLMNEEGQYINSKCGRNHCTSLETQLKQGVYYLNVTMKWDKNPYPITVSTYGVSHVEIKRTGYEIFTKFSENMIKSFSNKIKGEIKNFGSYGINEATKQIYFSLMTGIGYIKIKNPSNKKFKIEIKFKSFENIQILEPYKLPLIFDMKQNTEYIIGFKIFPSFSPDKNLSEILTPYS